MTLVFGLCAGGAVTALANENGGVQTVVGPVTTTITALNYDESGAHVNGFLVGTNVLLTFSKNVCAGVSSLGAVGNTITYSGAATTFASGFQTVSVSSFSNTTTSASYPPAPTPAPSAYAATAGTITALNYSEEGTVNGFLFTPSSSSAVFVDIGQPSTTLAPLLTVGAAVTVTGTLEAPSPCAASGTISEVNPSSLLIGSTTYPIMGGRRH